MARKRGELGNMIRNARMKKMQGERAENDTDGNANEQPAQPRNASAADNTASGMGSPTQGGSHQGKGRAGH